MAKHIVASVDELPPGSRKIVEVGGRSIGVFNVQGEYFALRNRCPHQGGPLCAGKLFGFAIAQAPGEIEYLRPGEILTCAWHGWEFDLRTGQSYCDPSRLRVRRYDVEIEPGSALVPDEPDSKGGAANQPTTPSGVIQSRGGADPHSKLGLAFAEAVAAAGLVPGPYVAETYPVTIDGQYIVVELHG